MRRVWHVALCYNAIDLGLCVTARNPSGPDSAPDSGIRRIQMRTAIEHVLIVMAE